MCSVQFCSQTPFMNFGGPPQISSMNTQFSAPFSGLESNEPKDRTRDWGNGNNDRDFDARRRRQPSPIPDQRNANFGRDQNTNENSDGRQPRWVQSDTVAARNDHSVRQPWQQTNMPSPREGAVRREGESRWNSSSVSAPRDERNRGDSRWNEPSPMISRDNRSRNEPWEEPNIVNDRDQAYTRSVRSPSRPSNDLHRYKDSSDLPNKNYEDRNVVQGNWGVGYDQQITTRYPERCNSNVFGESGQLSSMFGNHATETVQEPSGSQKGHGPSRWDNSNRTNNRPQDIPQQRHFSENNRPERVSRPSPRYEERDNFRQSKDRAFNKRPQGPRTVQEPPAKRFNSQPYAKPNLPNTTGRPSPSHPPRKEPLKQKQSGSQQKTNMAALLHKDHTWRHQAAAALAKQTLKSMDIKDMGSKDLITKKLKGSIKSRIDVLLGEKVAIPMEDIVKMYRERFLFKTDQAFFVAVLDSMKNDEENQVNTNKSGNDIFYLK